MRENIWKNIKLGFKTNKLAVAGAAAIILLALISIFAFLYPVDPNAISATERLNAPSMAHPFGTDDMGRDYLARCIYGGRASLLVGFLSMVLSTCLLYTSLYAKYHVFGLLFTEFGIPYRRWSIRWCSMYFHSIRFWRCGRNCDHRSGASCVSHHHNTEILLRIYE